MSVVDSTPQTAPDLLGRPADGGATVHVGIVHVGGLICHVAADAVLERLHGKLAAYARENCSWQLSQEDADRVRSLTARGDAHQAVEHYFAKVGSRWDLERLTVMEVPVSPGDGRR